MKAWLKSFDLLTGIHVKQSIVVENLGDGVLFGDSATGLTLDESDGDDRERRERNRITDA